MDKRTIWTGHFHYKDGQMKIVDPMVVQPSAFWLLPAWIFSITLKNNLTPQHLNMDFMIRRRVFMNTSETCEHPDQFSGWTRCCALENGWTNSHLLEIHVQCDKLCSTDFHIWMRQNWVGTSLHGALDTFPSWIPYRFFAGNEWKVVLLGGLFLSSNAFQSSSWKHERKTILLIDAIGH